jgi:hypothetical protein
MNEATNARIAERLRALNASDREWLLAALAPEECRLVSAALRAHRQQTPSEVPPAELEPASGTRPLEDAVARLDAADPQEITKIVGPLPDWAIALVISTHPWRWAQAFLGEHAPGRVRALRALAMELEDVKPRVRTALLRVLAAQLEPAAPRSAAAQTFDAALERALENRI